MAARDSRRLKRVDQSPDTVAAPSVLQVSHSAITRVDLVTASRTILAPDNLPKWFKGAHDVRIANGYPDVGGTMDWAVGKGGRWRFHAVVEHGALPGLLVSRVRTPSGSSLITQRFEAVAGGTQYTKTVEFTGGRLQRLLLKSFLARSVRGEVERAAALATATAP